MARGTAEELSFSAWLARAPVSQVNHAKRRSKEGAEGKTIDRKGRKHANLFYAVREFVRNRYLLVEVFSCRSFTDITRVLHTMLFFPCHEQNRGRVVAILAPISIRGAILCRALCSLSLLFGLLFSKSLAAHKF